MSAEPARRGLTVAEAAAQLRCHESTVRRLVARGELRGERVGQRLYLLDPDSVAAWKPRREGRPPKPRPA